MIHPGSEMPIFASSPRREGINTHSQFSTMPKFKQNVERRRNHPQLQFSIHAQPPPATLSEPRIKLQADKTQMGIIFSLSCPFPWQAGSLAYRDRNKDNRRLNTNKKTLHTSIPDSTTAAFNINIDIPLPHTQP
jgi:hypothetical protein